MSISRNDEAPPGSSLASQIRALLGYALILYGLLTFVSPWLLPGLHIW